MIDKLSNTDNLNIVLKINELIEVVNSITENNDLSRHNKSLTCDRLVPLSNEITDLAKRYKESQLEQSDISELMDPQSLLNNISCPNCGSKSFTRGHTTTTLAYYPLTYVEGKCVSTGKNTSKTHYRCSRCNNEWIEET